MTDHDKELFTIVKESYDRRNAERMENWNKLIETTPYAHFKSFASVDSDMCGLRMHDFRYEVVFELDNGVVCTFKYDAILTDNLDGIVEEKSKFPYGKKQKSMKEINRFLAQFDWHYTLDNVVLYLPPHKEYYVASLMRATSDGHEIYVHVKVFPREDKLDMSKWED